MLFGSYGFSGSVRCIFEDSQNNLWFGTDFGVVRFGGSVFTKYTTANGLADNLCNSITEDAIGNIWCLNFHAISIFNGSNWTINYPLVNGEFTSFYEVFSDHYGTIWLACSKGILKQGPLNTWNNIWKPAIMYMLWVKMKQEE